MCNTVVCVYCSQAVHSTRWLLSFWARPNSQHHSGTRFVEQVNSAILISSIRIRFDERKKYTLHVMHHLSPCQLFVHCCFLAPTKQPSVQAPATRITCKQRENCLFAVPFVLQGFISSLASSMNLLRLLPVPFNY